MPPKRQRKKNKGLAASVESKAPLVRSWHETKATVPPEFDPLQILTALKQGKSSRKTIKALSSDDAFELVPGSKESKEKLEEQFDATVEMALLKNAVRSIFKADKPYRARLGYYNNVATSAAGVLNFSLNVNSIGSVAEWASIDALFDECFVHSMTWRYQPYNRHGSAGVHTTGGINVPAVATAGASGLVFASGVVVVALFHGASNYTTANAMLDNATMKLALSDEPWSYAWRNNERFDARGPAMADTTGLSWQGWMAIADVARLAGNIQMRAAVDQALGDQVHIFDLGSVAVLFDVSFRARA